MRAVFDPARGRGDETFAVHEGERWSIADTMAGVGARASIDLDNALGGSGVEFVIGHAGRTARIAPLLAKHQPRGRPFANRTSGSATGVAAPILPKPPYDSAVLRSLVAERIASFNVPRSRT